MGVSDDKTRPRLPSPRRRALIEGAAAAAFGADGYEYVSLDRIAAAAGVTKPIVYRHFPSKEELYLALLDRHSDQLGRFAVPESPDELGGALPDLLDGWFAYVADHSHVWRMLFEDTGGGARIEARRAEVRARARQVLAAVLEVARPGLEREPLQASAELLRGGLVSLTLWWLDRPELPRAVVVSAATGAVAGLLRAPDANGSLP